MITYGSLNSGLVPHKTYLCCLAACFLAVAGCGGEAGPAVYPVTGTVTFDGSPVEKGRIQFTPVSGDRAFSAEIKDGAYELEAQPGKMKVAIRASRIIPGKFDTSNPDEDPQPMGEMYIPDVYNSRTTLEAEVTAGENNFPFALEKAK